MRSASAGSRSLRCVPPQTCGVTLAAQQPYTHRARGAAGLRRGCGGTRVAAHERLREDLALPASGRPVALLTQQICNEGGAADTADPFAGSTHKALTDEIEQAAQALIDKVDELGGSVQCIPFIRAEVEESAWGYEERYKQKQDIVVGVNEYVTDSVDEVEILRVDPDSERQQLERLEAFKADRDQEAMKTRLEELRSACRGTDNLLHPLRAALKDRGTVGEVCGVMRDEFGGVLQA